MTWSLFSNANRSLPFAVTAGAELVSTVEAESEVIAIFTPAPSLYSQVESAVEVSAASLGTLPLMYSEIEASVEITQASLSVPVPVVLYSVVEPEFGFVSSALTTASISSVLYAVVEASAEIASAELTSVIALESQIHIEPEIIGLVAQSDGHFYSLIESEIEIEAHLTRALPTWLCLHGAASDWEEIEVTDSTAECSTVA